MGGGGLAKMGFAIFLFWRFLGAPRLADRELVMGFFHDEAESVCTQKRQFVQFVPVPADLRGVQGWPWLDSPGQGPGQPRLVLVLGRWTACEHDGCECHGFIQLLWDGMWGERVRKRARAGE